MNEAYTSEVILFIFGMMIYSLGETLLVQPGTIMSFDYFLALVLPLLIVTWGVIFQKVTLKRILYYIITASISIVSYIRFHFSDGWAGILRTCDAPKCVPDGKWILGIIMGFILFIWLIVTIGYLVKAIKYKLSKTHNSLTHNP